MGQSSDGKYANCSCALNVCASTNCIRRITVRTVLVEFITALVNIQAGGVGVVQNGQSVAKAEELVICECGISSYRGYSLSRVWM